jgi:predicted nucleic acid-binding protein
MAFPVFLDTCVLAPYTLCDTLLRFADAQTYRPLWSEDVLIELRRTLIGRLDVTEAKADRRIAVMRASFPDAEVTGYRDLISKMENDEKDRHVLAAAVRGQAAIIVTANLRDFPRCALAPYDLDARSPDDFLLDQLDLYPDVTLGCLQQHADAYRRPEMTVADLLNQLEGSGAPEFAAAVRRELRF